MSFRSQQIAGLLQTQPALFDFEGTRDMQCLDGLSSEEITALLEGGHEQPELPPSNVKKIKGGK